MLRASELQERFRYGYQKIELTFRLVNIQCAPVISRQELFKHPQRIFKLFQYANNKIIFKHSLLCPFNHSTLVLFIFPGVGGCLTFRSIATKELNVPPE